MIYLTVMNIACFGIIVYILGENEITYQDLSFWGIMVTILVMQAVTTIYCKEKLTKDSSE